MPDDGPFRRRDDEVAAVEVLEDALEPGNRLPKRNLHPHHDVQPCIAQRIRLRRHQVRPALRCTAATPRACAQGTKGKEALASSTCTRLSYDVRASHRGKARQLSHRNTVEDTRLPCKAAVQQH